MDLILETSFVFLLVLELKSQRRATRSHSCPGTSSSLSSMKTASACLCVCVCVRRERERVCVCVRRERERGCVCVHMRVCVLIQDLRVQYQVSNWSPYNNYKTNLLSPLDWLICSSCLLYHSSSSVFAWFFSSSNAVFSSVSFFDSLSLCPSRHCL